MTVRQQIIISCCYQDRAISALSATVISDVAVRADCSINLTPDSLLQRQWLSRIVSRVKFTGTAAGAAIFSHLNGSTLPATPDLAGISNVLFFECSLFRCGTHWLVYLYNLQRVGCGCLHLHSRPTASGLLKTGWCVWRERWTIAGHRTGSALLNIADMFGDTFCSAWHIGWK